MKSSFMVSIIVSMTLFSRVTISSETKLFREIEGPTVLHASIKDQWGGHTFSYLLTGEEAIFWSATAYIADDQTPTALVGQHPKAGSSIKPAVSTIRFDEPNAIGNNQPQMIRTPDGYIHVFIGVTYSTDNPNYNVGRISYFRSEKPEDVSKLIDKTELLPTEPYSDFHLRMNVGVSQDGQKMALVILAISEDGRVPFNTPVIFIGQKQGADFIFKKPIQFAEPMSFFYPQVAFTDEGIVLVGQVWDNYERTTTRLLHLDGEGKLIHREQLPIPDKDGRYISYQLHPFSQLNWNKLVLYYNKAPQDSIYYHEFWEYDVQRRKLRLLRSIETERGFSNSGKLISVSDKSFIFVNNPSMGQLQIWQGNISGENKLKRTPLYGTNPRLRGYLATAYIFVPNPLEGSIVKSGENYIASDYFNPCRKNENSAPCSFLLWHLFF